MPVHLLPACRWTPPACSASTTSSSRRAGCQAAQAAAGGTAASSSSGSRRGEARRLRHLTPRLPRRHDLNFSTHPDAPAPLPPVPQPRPHCPRLPRHSMRHAACPHALATPSQLAFTGSRAGQGRWRRTGGHAGQAQAGAPCCRDGERGSAACTSQRPWAGQAVRRCGAGLARQRAQAAQHRGSCRYGHLGSSRLVGASRRARGGDCNSGGAAWC